MLKTKRFFNVTKLERNSEIVLDTGQNEAKKKY